MANKARPMRALTGRETAILLLEVKKHVRIFLLWKAGLRGVDIAHLLSTNPGHVGRVLAEYRADPTKQAAALKLCPIGEA